MSNQLLDKNIFARDPLLGSLLVVTDNLPFNCNFVGDEEVSKRQLPAFTYAVNQWRTEADNSVGSKENKAVTVKQEVLMAIFKKMPNSKDESFVWDATHKANGRTVDMSFKYPFEKWKTETYQELKTIIDALTCKGHGRKEEVFYPEGHPKAGQRAGLIDHTYLADYFGFEVDQGKVNYLYIHQQGDQGIYGVGAVFTLNSCFIDCCPKFQKSKLNIASLKAQGFVIENI